MRGALPSSRHKAKKFAMLDQLPKLPALRHAALPMRAPAMRAPAMRALATRAPAVCPSATPAPVTPAPVTSTPATSTPATSIRITPALAALALTAVLLAGCSSSSDLSRTFGITRDAPDEYTVTTQVPLSMPPDFAVRPPQPGAPRPQQVSEQQQAEQVLAPQTALANAPEAQASAGQQALVQSAGPTPPANIRAEVNGEASAAAQQNDSFVDKLMFWSTAPAPGIVVDPQKEQQRIRENAALGRSQDSGDTPIIQPKKKGWLEGLF